MGNSNSYLTKEAHAHAVKAAGWICTDTGGEVPLVGFSSSPPKQGEIFQMRQSETELWDLEAKEVILCLQKERFPDGKYYTPYKGITSEIHLPFVVFVPV